jgi:hypothetical protein
LIPPVPIPVPPTPVPPTPIPPTPDNHSNSFPWWGIFLLVVLGIIIVVAIGII